MENMEQVIKDCMIQYSGAVLQSRALVDVRDCLKPSARQIFYCMYTDKFISNKPFKKTLKAIGSAARMFIHGDSSCEGIIMRAGQPFAMRYPLIEVEGSEGNLTASGNWSAPRYTASRLSSICDSLFQDIEKNTISEWRDNYDDTEQYPAVLPSKSFYNIVNGTFGIGTGLAASIPQFNLIELNESLIKLLNNPNISDDELIIMPDFATGALLLNGKEIIESLKNGTGPSCKLRSVINWNESEKCLIVTEIPYGVYTNTICNELEEIIESEENPGIDRFNDLTGTQPLIKIYINKKTNYKEILSYLYNKTSLQYYYGINMTMLDNGRFPKVFTWKEALQAHINHEKIVYRRSFEFDLAKIEKRIHIIDGLLICIANLDEVIKLIKNSESPNAASLALQRTFLLDEEQAKAVLAIKLASLAKLEVKKLEEEKIKLTEEANRIKIILENEKEFNQQLINGWNEVSKKFGDKRRTKIYDNFIEDEKPQKIIKDITIYININNDYIVKEEKPKQLKSFKKGKVKFIMNGTTDEKFYVFTNIGKCYCLDTAKFFESKEGNFSDFLKLDEKEEIVASYGGSKINEVVYVATKFGLIKKIACSEITSIKKSKNYITLQEYDSVIDVVFSNDVSEKICMGSKQGNIVVFDGTSISCTKLPSKGILGMKIDTLTDEVVTMNVINDIHTQLCTITTAGYIKRTSLEEYPITMRGTKGRLAHKYNNDNLIEIVPISNSDYICKSKVFGDIPISTIPEAVRTARGIDILKM